MLPQKVRVFVATRPADMRGSFNRLSGIIRDVLGAEPRSGALFVFFNKRCTLSKVFFADGTGECILYKRLDFRTYRGVFDFDPARSHVEIEAGQLKILMRGVEKPRRRIVH